ncbi:unnamed protein product, partial [Prorocentrum cordatum]
MELLRERMGRRLRQNLTDPTLRSAFAEGGAPASRATAAASKLGAAAGAASTSGGRLAEGRGGGGGASAAPGAAPGAAPSAARAALREVAAAEALAAGSAGPRSSPALQQRRHASHAAPMETPRRALSGVLGGLGEGSPLMSASCSARRSPRSDLDKPGEFYTHKWPQQADTPGRTSARARPMKVATINQEPISLRGGGRLRRTGEDEDDEDPMRRSRRCRR